MSAGILAPDPSIAQHSVMSPSAGMSPGSHSPGSALPATMQPAEGRLAAEHSNGVLQNEASFAETDGAPITPPTLGKQKVTVSMNTQSAQSRSWFGFFLGYQASTASGITTADAPATAPSEAAAIVTQHTSESMDLPVPAPEKHAPNNVRVQCALPDASTALRDRFLEPT